MDRKVMVVDDDEAIRLLVQHCLKKYYQVIVAENALAAMGMLNAGQVPDLIVTDIRMPHMSGVELIRNLRVSGLYRNIPVILLSAIDPEEEEVPYQQYGAAGYVQKPFDPQDLRDTINQVFNRSRIRRSF